MRCLRCQGCLVPERLVDLLDDTGQLHCDGWRCLNCGAILDPLVLGRRDRGEPVSADRPRPKRRWNRQLVPVVITHE
jgi:hypothetical protein